MIYSLVACGVGKNLPGCPVALTYDESDPFLVTFEFRSEKVTTWVIGRELLVEALATGVQAGGRDVTLRAEGRALFLTLSSPSGRAVVRFDAAEITDFLERSFHVVPLGREMTMVDLDAELAAL